MRRVRRTTLFYGFTGVLCLTAVGAVATAQPRRVAHPVSHPRAGECLQCHQGAAEAVFSPTLSNKCAACHTTDVTGLQKAAMRRSAAKPAPEAEAGPAQEEQSSWPKAEGQGPGMSVAMYYEQTRIGASPNEMVLIPAGEFIRGSNQRLSDEGPQHTASLPDFHIDKYEVTNLQYQRFIDATQRKSPDHFENRTFPPGKADHPVTFVTWHDAKAYCEWAGKRLPTDQEWEKAARGVDGRTYPWGNVFDINKVNSPVRWATLKLEGDTTPVGAFEGGVSPYGVYDMSGNVWEWTESWYKAYPGNTKPTENYGEKYKTLKGGSWWDCSFYKCGISAPVYNRSFFMRTTRNNSFGFRCASDKAPATHRSS